jgi:hypothetical protein
MCKAEQIVGLGTRIILVHYTTLVVSLITWVFIFVILCSKSVIA